MSSTRQEQPISLQEEIERHQQQLARNQNEVARNQQELAGNQEEVARTQQELARNQQAIDRSQQALSITRARIENLLLRIRQRRLESNEFDFAQRQNTSQHVSSLTQTQRWNRHSPSHDWLSPYPSSCSLAQTNLGRQWSWRSLRALGFVAGLREDDNGSGSAGSIMRRLPQVQHNLNYTTGEPHPICNQLCGYEMLGVSATPTHNFKPSLIAFLRTFPFANGRVSDCSLPELRCGHCDAILRLSEAVCKCTAKHCHAFRHATCHWNIGQQRTRCY